MALLNKCITMWEMKSKIRQGSNFILFTEWSNHYNNVLTKATYWHHTMKLCNDILYTNHWSELQFAAEPVNLVAQTPGTCGFCLSVPGSYWSKILVWMGYCHIEGNYVAVLCLFFVQRVSAVFGALRGGRNAHMVFQKFCDDFLISKKEIEQFKQLFTTNVTNLWYFLIHHVRLFTTYIYLRMRSSVIVYADENHVCGYFIGSPAIDHHLMNIWRRLKCFPFHFLLMARLS